MSDIQEIVLESECLSEKRVELNVDESPVEKFS